MLLSQRNRIPKYKILPASALWDSNPRSLEADMQNLQTSQSAHKEFDRL